MWRNQKWSNWDNSSEIHYKYTPIGVEPGRKINILLEWVDGLIIINTTNLRMEGMFLS